VGSADGPSIAVAEESGVVVCVLVGGAEEAASTVEGLEEG
jgi:hypothetical protein